MNKAEQYVSNLCRNSFLSLWTYPNPQGKKGKELCDLLVVCGPDVIVISVKDIEFKNTGDYAVALGRWQRRAVQRSVKQVFKAERWLGLEELKDRVTTKSGEAGLALPDEQHRRLHRIAVALGGETKIPLSSGLFNDKGQDKYVHVFDAISFGTTIQELDTITDFVAYLQAKEALPGQMMMAGDEEDLLALYLKHGRKFPDKDITLLGEGFWQAFSQSEPFRARKQKDKISYVWDRITETFCASQLNGELLGMASLDDVEQALRTMAQEDRFTRRALGKNFTDFLEASRNGQTRARIQVDPGLATYVFLACPLGHPREDRLSELRDRCLVARWLHPNKAEVIGIATEVPKPGQGFSFDLISFRFTELTPEEIELAKRIQQEFGYFKNPRRQKHREEEYPN